MLLQCEHYVIGKGLTYAVAEILFSTSSGHPGGSSTLITPAVSSIKHFVSLFEAGELIVPC